MSPPVPIPSNTTTSTTSTTSNALDEGADNALAALRASGITLCADTVEYSKLAEIFPPPADVILTPTNVLDAISKTEYAHLLAGAAKYASENAISEAQDEADEQDKTPGARVNMAMNRLLALLGSQILRMIPGRVSLPLDPRLFTETCPTNTTRPHSSADSYSYTPEDLATALSRARALLAENDALDLARPRVMILIPATPLGMAVAHALEAAGAHADMALVVTPAQALACAQAGASVVSLDMAMGAHGVRRVVSDFTGCGYSKRTEIAACGFGSVEEVLQLAQLDEAVNIVSLASAVMNDLRNMTAGLPSADASGDSAAEDVVVASALAEYFSSSDGRITDAYLTAIMEDPSAAEIVSAKLEKLSMDTHMLEALLKAELEQVMSGQDALAESQSSLNTPVHSSVSESESDITASFVDCLENLGLTEDEGSSEDGGSLSEPASASTTDFEDVDLHTPQTASSHASEAGDGPTQDITDVDEAVDIAPKGDYDSKPLENSQVDMEQSITLTNDSHDTTDAGTVPIPEREKPKMSVKERVMEIEARLEADNEVGGVIPESESGVSVHA